MQGAERASVRRTTTVNRSKSALSARTVLTLRAPSASSRYAIRRSLRCDGGVAGSGRSDTCVGETSGISDSVTKIYVRIALLPITTVIRSKLSFDQSSLYLGMPTSADVAVKSVNGACFGGDGTEVAHLTSSSCHGLQGVSPGEIPVADPSSHRSL